MPVSLAGGNHMGEEIAKSTPVGLPTGDGIESINLKIKNNFRAILSRNDSGFDNSEKLSKVSVGRGKHGWAMTLVSNRRKTRDMCLL